jgi:hypothetical protein
MKINYSMQHFSGTDTVNENTAKWLVREGTKKIWELAEQINKKFKEENSENSFGAIVSISTTSNDPNEIYISIKEQ